MINRTRYQVVVMYKGDHPYGDSFKLNPPKGYRIEGEWEPFACTDDQVGWRRALTPTAKSIDIHPSTNEETP